MTGRCKISASLLALAVGYELRGIVEKDLLRDAFAIPPLVGEFLHPGHAAVEPFEAEHPADDDPVPAHEYRTDALRRYASRAGEHPPLVGDQRLPAAARYGLIFLHRGIRRVELFERLRVGILLHPGDESFQRLRRRRHFSLRDSRQACCGCPGPASRTASGSAWTCARYATFLWGR